MYDYDYYYKQEPSEIDILIDETVDKIRDTILLKAKEDVESETQKSKKIQEKYDMDKKVWDEIRQRQNKQILELTNKLKNLEEEYNKKRSETPSLDFEVGEKVLEAELQYRSGALVCPTCKGKGKVNVQSEEYGDIEATCPHCKNNTYEGENNLVRKIEYHQYRPRTTTVVRATVHFEENNKMHTTYYTKEHSGSCELSHSEIKHKIFKAKDIEACRKYCEELNKEILEEAKKHIYQKEN